MTLNEWASLTKRQLFDELVNGVSPSIGTFDREALKGARSKGSPQMGATTFTPNLARFEFVYSDHESTVLLTIEVEPPERIVFMPVPRWVVESIWQGHIDGSHHFESDAKELLTEFEGLIAPDANSKLFESRSPVGRH